LRVIDLLLQATDLQDCEPEKLTNRKDFKEFFDQSDMRTGDARNHYWYAVMNGFEANNYYVKETLMELEVLRQEILYVLSHLEITDQEVFTFLKKLSYIIMANKRQNSGNEGIKGLTNFLWGILSGWSLVNRYSEKDDIEAIINKL